MGVTSVPVTRGSEAGAAGRSNQLPQSASLAPCLALPEMFCLAEGKVALITATHAKRQPLKLNCVTQ